MKKAKKKVIYVEKDFVAFLLKCQDECSAWFSDLMFYRRRNERN